MLVVFAPGSRRKVVARRVSRRPWLAPRAGEVIREGPKKLRVRSTAARVEHRGDVVEHVIEVETRAVSRPRVRQRAAPAANVVRMPVGDASMVAEFIRYHVLVRVFGGDAEAWLAHLRANGDLGGDLRFVRCIRSRLRQDPTLIVTIRRMVDATPFWRVAEA